MGTQDVPGYTGHVLYLHALQMDIQYMQMLLMYVTACSICAVNNSLLSEF